MNEAKDVEGGAHSPPASRTAIPCPGHWKSTSANEHRPGMWGAATSEYSQVPWCTRCCCSSQTWWHSVSFPRGATYRKDRNSQ